MIRRAAVATVLVLGVTSGCGLFSDDEPTPEPTVADKCVGQPTPGVTTVIQAGPGSLPGGGSAVLVEAKLDATPPTADIALLGVGPGESNRAAVKVGDLVTVKAKKYSVTRICTDVVDLLPQQ